MWLLIVIVPALIWLDFRLFKFYYKVIFKDEDDFNESVKYSVTPDIFSLFKGEYFRDRVAESKLGFFIFLCVGTVGLEIFIVNGIMQRCNLI